MQREYAYTVIERKEGGWAGNYGSHPTKGQKGGGDGGAAKAGAASPGRITGGVLTASSEAEAREKILESHGKNAEIIDLSPRTVMVDLG